jgi:hypothetical protein
MKGRSCTTPPLMTPEKTKIRTHDMHDTNIDSHKVKDSKPGPCITPPLIPQKVKDSNPWSCTTPPLTPKSQRFEPTTMHYTTIDPPKCQIFEPMTMHYTTIDPPKDKNSNPRPCTAPPLMTSEKTNMTKIQTHDHALHHWWPPKRQIFKPTTCTTPPLTPTKSKIWTQGHALHHHWPPKSQRFYHALHHHWLPKCHKDSNPRPLTQTSKIRTPTIIHYTTIDPQRWKIWTHDVHYTTIDPHKVKIRTGHFMSNICRHKQKPRHLFVICHHMTTSENRGKDHFNFMTLLGNFLSWVWFSWPLL